MSAVAECVESDDTFYLLGFVVNPNISYINFPWTDRAFYIYIFVF